VNPKPTGAICKEIGVTPATASLIRTTAPLGSEVMVTRPTTESASAGWRARKEVSASAGGATVRLMGSEFASSHDSMFPGIRIRPGEGGSSMATAPGAGNATAGLGAGGTNTRAGVWPTAGAWGAGKGSGVDDS
jgi:hypothetical protein